MTLNENQKAVPIATKAPKAGDFMRISGFGKEGVSVFNDFILFTKLL